jgi:hypothetical protein
MSYANNTMSWLNTVLSIEKVFRDLFEPNLPLYRFSFPGDTGKQRSLVHDKALFINTVQGDIDRFQDTYVTIWLAERHQQQNYIPSYNLKGVWLQEQATVIQEFLNRGDASKAYLFPLYDYKRNIPQGIYDQFLIDGDTSAIEQYLTGTPPVIGDTGFVVRAGSTSPQLDSNVNPMTLEWTTVWQHYNRTAWSAQRG